MTRCNGPISVPSDAGPMEQRRSGLNWDRFTRGSLSSQITEEGSDGMAKRVAELMVEVLPGAGVKTRPVCAESGSQRARRRVD